MEVWGWHTHWSNVNSNNTSNLINTTWRESFDTAQTTLRHTSPTNNTPRACEQKNECMSRLKEMSIQLGSNYSNLLDIGTHPITKNWARFIKMPLKNPLQDGVALLSKESLHHDDWERYKKVLNLLLMPTTWGFIWREKCYMENPYTISSKPLSKRITIKAANTSSSLSPNRKMKGCRLSYPHNGRSKRCSTWV